MLVPHLQDLHHQGKPHGQVNVGLGYVLMQPLHEDGHADGDQKGERQDLQGRMAQDEFTDGTGEEENPHEGEDHRRDDNPQVLGKPHGRDYRIDGKDDIQQHDLADHGGKGGTGPVRRVFFGFLEFNRVMNLVHGLVKQEQAAGQENQIPDGKSGHDGLGQPGQGDHNGQHEDTGQHGQAQPDKSRPFAL
ncbi:hypothetical protein DESC_310057 [Desulfosarcina cetonica]|nr:hypothetical protein DESC_310057 [Desulfosarcina cetonica]